MKRATFPGDTIPLAYALDQVQQVVLGKESHRAKMLAVATLLSDPAINAILDRVVPERRDR